MVFGRLLAACVVFVSAVCAQACDPVETRIGENPPPDTTERLYPACQVADTWAFGTCIVSNDGTPSLPLISTKATITRIGPQTFEGQSNCAEASSSAVQMTVRATNGYSWRIVYRVLGQPDDLLKVGDEIDFTLDLRVTENRSLWQTAAIARDGELVWFLSLSDRLPQQFLAPYGVELEGGEPYCEFDGGGGYREVLNSIWITSQDERIELRHQETGHTGDLTVLLGSYVTEPNVYTGIAAFRRSRPAGG